MKKSLSWLVLALTIFLGIWHAQPPKVVSLPPAKTELIWVGNLSSQDYSWRDKGAWAVYPTRGGREGENWTIFDTLATGSRSPLPAEAARVALERFHTSPGGKELEDRIAQRSLGERLLVVGMRTQSAHGEALLDKEGQPLCEVLLIGEGVPPGLLTSPSTRFTPGLIAATDVAATVRGQSFGAGRPAVVVPGTLAQLESQRVSWEEQSAATRWLVVLPWLLTPLLLLAFWKQGELLGRLVAALPLGTLLAPVLVAFLGAGYTQSYLTPLFFLFLTGISAWRFSVKQLAVLTALVLWGSVALSGSVLEHTPFSSSITEAARFYGIGNEGAGLLIGCALAAGFELPILLAVALVIGVPSLGANNGCFLAALVAIVARELARLPQTKRLWAAVLALVGIGLLFWGLARWDASRGAAEQTHLGQVVSGKRAGLLALVGRKLAMNGHLLVSSPWSLLMLVSGVLLARRRAWTELAGGAAALALNDSGVLAAATLLVPLAALKAQSPSPSRGEGLRS